MKYEVLSMKYFTQELFKKQINKNMITYDEFKKVEIRAGKILSAEKIPETDKLLKLMVDFGETEEVTISFDSKAIDSTSVDSNAKSNAGLKTANGEPGAATSKISNGNSNATVSKILNTDSVPATPKVLKSKPRQIVSGIALKFPDVASLVGKTCMFVTNLEPRTIKGHESNGMLFAVSTPEGGFSLLEPNATITPGTLAA